MPLETDSVLVVDANTVLAFPIAFEPLQPVTGRQSQVAQRSGRIQYLQFLECGFAEVCRNAAAAFFVPKPLRLGIPEGFDHRGILSQCVTNVEHQYLKEA